MTASAPPAGDVGEPPVPAGLVERLAADAVGEGRGDGVGARVTKFAARGERVVLEYGFPDGLRLFAKRYPRAEQASAAFDVLRVLRARGFGAESPHRVPEPLGCFADDGVLVMRAAAGSTLVTRVEDAGEWERGLRAAATWLARLHGLAVGLEPRDDVGQGALALARRAAAAGAARPELLDVFLALLEELAARARASDAAGPPVPSHGRFHAAHVHLAGAVVTVIDLDGAALADPAKDVGEFLHRLRAYARRRALGIEAAERATATFVEEYARRSGAVPAGLVYHWSYSVVATILRTAALGRPRWERRVEFYRREFEDVPRRVAALAAD